MTPAGDRDSDDDIRMNHLRGDIDHAGAIAAVTGAETALFVRLQFGTRALEIDGHRRRPQRSVRPD